MLTAAHKEDEVIASWFCFAAGHQSSPLEMQTAKDVIASLASHLQSLTLYNTYNTSSIQLQLQQLTLRGAKSYS